MKTAAVSPTEARLRAKIAAMAESMADLLIGRAVALEAVRFLDRAYLADREGDAADAAHLYEEAHRVIREGGLTL